LWLVPSLETKPAHLIFTVDPLPSSQGCPLAHRARHHLDLQRCNRLLEMAPTAGTRECRRARVLKISRTTVIRNLKKKSFVTFQSRREVRETLANWKRLKTIVHLVPVAGF